jgi:glycerol-3-phosphate acyltransferase PlsX
MKIALDVVGGDYAPDATIAGVKQALPELPENITVVLIGPEALIRSKQEELQLYTSRVEVVAAEEVIAMGEHPTKALSQKPNASIPVGYRLLKTGKIDAFCSAGNTGAMHVGAMFSIKTISGIIRPGIAGFAPKESGGLGVIMDVGANADCKPDVLLQFGEIASVYAQHVLKINNPKVGLMSLGIEEKKGTLLTQAAYQLFKLNKKVNFIGNIEGYDIFNDKADVIVCDGFTGNVILKLAESIYTLLKKRSYSDPFFDQFNYEAIGGSPILGVNGNVIIGHGVSSAAAIKNMLLQAREMVQSKVHQKIKESLQD